MAEFVIKRDGKKEPYDAEKIRKSILGAAARAELPEERKNEIVEKVSGAAMELADGKEEIASTEIEEKILSELDVLEPSISESWRKHVQEKGKA